MPVVQGDRFAGFLFSLSSSMGNQERALEGFENSSLLLVQKNGIITRADCPFSLLCTNSIDELIEGTVYSVSEVIGSTDDKIIFIIEGKPYCHTNFLLFHSLFPHADYKYPNYDLPF